MSSKVERAFGFLIGLMIAVQFGPVEAQPVASRLMVSSSLGEPYAIERVDWSALFRAVDLAAQPFDSRMIEIGASEVPSEAARVAKGDSLFRFGKFIGRFEVGLVESKYSASPGALRTFTLSWNLIRPERNFDKLSFKTNKVELQTEFVCSQDSCDVQSKLQAIGTNRLDAIGVRSQKRFDRQMARVLYSYDKDLALILSGRARR
jgi:hypothetical protein